MTAVIRSPEDHEPVSGLNRGVGLRVEFHPLVLPQYADDDHQCDDHVLKTRTKNGHQTDGHRVADHLAAVREQHDQRERQQRRDGDEPGQQLSLFRSQNHDRSELTTS
jgi:hypothetical protein